MARKRTLQYFSAMILAVSFPALLTAANGRGAGGNTTTTTSTTLEASSTVVDLGGYPNALAIDPAGRTCTAYFKGSELRFAVFNGTSWAIQSVGMVGGDYGAGSVDLAVNGFGRPGIVFYVSRLGGVVVNRVGFATSDGTSWNVQIIDANGFAPSIAYDSLGQWVVAYTKSDAAGLALNLAEYSGSSWAMSSVDNTTVSGGSRYIYSPSVAVDAFGNVGVSYGYDIPAYTKQVRYAYRSAGAWKISQIIGADMATSTSLAFDSSGKPCVAYWAAVTKSLNMANADGSGGWLRTRLPWNGTGVAGEVSLSLDSLGTAYLTAYDTGSADLLLYRGSSGNFSAQTLASTGTVGRSNSLGVNNATGQKCVTYSDQTAGVLKFLGMN